MARRSRPDLVLSINTVSYKSISLNFSILYKLGYYFRRNSVNYSTLFSQWNSHSDYSVRWQQPGDEVFTDVPAMTYPASSSRDNFYLGSEPLVEKGDHVRLQYVNLSYGLDGKRIGLPLRTIQFSVNANNLGILWKANRSGIDPDYNGLYTMPAPAIYSLGIKAGF